jgi:[NiFe] hydrogenase small subunit
LAAVCGLINNRIKEVQMEKEERAFYEKLEGKGVSRRDFMKFCTFLTATMGLSSSFIPKVAEVFAAPMQRPPVIWLHFGECTGCTEAAIRTMYPWIDQLVLEVLDVEYQETIMAAAGHQAEEQLHNAVEKYKGKFICVVEGAIATKFNGGYGKVGGKTFLQTGKEVCSQAAGVICIGSCAAYGNIQAAKPNPGGYKGVGEALGIKTVNIAGCPPNPINFVGTVVNYLLLGKLPALDNIGRPLFAYGQTIHDNCPRRGHFENEEFVKEFGSQEAADGYCLYKVGCRGPETYNNCSIVKYNDGTSWPVQAGHPCIGCSQPEFWDKFTPFYQEL